MSMISVEQAIPQLFKSAQEIVRRRKLLNAPHIAPLSDYVAQLRIRFPGWEFQEFDPLDGGVEADMLFLLEKPGPMTSPRSKRRGSGFISRDNDDATAEAIFEFMKQAGIDRKRVVLWNVIPGWNDTIRIKADEIRAGVAELANLLVLLPKLKTVVLVGRQAGRAERQLRAMNLSVFTSAHPSVKVRNMNRERWDRIPGQWAAAAGNHHKGASAPAPMKTQE